MATAGQVSYNQNVNRSLCLLAGVIAANGQPSLATDGVALTSSDPTTVTSAGLNYAGRASRESTLFLKGVGSGGTVTVTARLWGYSIAMGVWVPVGTGTDTGKGVINGGSAMGATKTNTVLHSEPLLLAGTFDRLYLEITNIGGTGTTVEAWLATARQVAY